MSAIRLERIRKRFGVVDAVRDVSVDVEDGELFVLVGPSGSGKSTLLRIVAGLEGLDEGRVIVGDQDVTRAAPSARDVAMVFQSFALFPHMTVEQNMGFGLAARRRPAADVRARVAQVARMLDLDALLARKPHELSGGERQRVALGRAMVREPRVFLLDEPLSNLDAQLRSRMRAEIVRIQRSLRATMLYVTHDQTEALSIGQRVAVVRDGRIEQVGTPDEIYARPATTFVASFIGEPPMNVLPATIQDGRARWSAGSVDAGARAGEVALGVRPEHVHVAGSRWTGTTRPVDPFTARVEILERAGDRAHLLMRAGDEQIVARVEPSFAPGDEVQAWLDPSHLHFFDATSGERLR